MAAKKAAPKTSAAKAAPKAARKAAPKKSVDGASAAAVKAPRKAAAVKAAAADKADKPAPPRKAVKKAAPAIKLSDAQTSLLKEIAGAGEAGLVGSKKIARSLEALKERKLIKKGKKDGEFFKYHVSKAGEKHLADQAAANPA